MSKARLSKSRFEHLLGLVVLVAATSLTLTEPKELPNMMAGSEDVSTVTKSLRALSAADESAPVNATVCETTIDPGVTELIVTFVRAPRVAKMLFWRVVVNCVTELGQDCLITLKMFPASRQAQLTLILSATVKDSGVA